MKQCILIGGGNTTDPNNPYETEHIDKRIVELVNKEQPIFLYIGLANSYADSRYDHIKKIFQNLKCQTQYLKKNNVIHNPKIVEEKINNADIIYIDGGDTLKLLDYVKKYSIDILLKKAYEKGTILVGKSAGAILLSKAGLSDSYILRGEKDTYEFVEGLNIEPIIICPHYTKEKQEIIKDKLTKKEIVYGIPNQTALIIKDHKIDKIEIENEQVKIIER